MPTEAIFASIASLAFFGSFAAVLAWGAWYSSRGATTRKN